MRRIGIIGSLIVVAAALMWSLPASAAKFFSSKDECAAAVRAGQAEYYSPHTTAPKRLEALRNDGRYAYQKYDAPTCIDAVVYVAGQGKSVSRKWVVQKPGDGYFAKLGPDQVPTSEGFMDGCANMIYAMESVTVRPVAAFVPPAPPPQAAVQQTQVVQVNVELYCSDGRRVANADDCIQVSTAPRVVRVPVYVQEEVIYEEAYIPPPRYVHAPRYYDQPSYGSSWRMPEINITRNTNVNRNVNINRNDNRNFNRFRDRQPRNPISRGTLTGDTGGNRILGRGGSGGNLTGGTGPGSGLGGNTGGNTGGYRILGRN